MIKYYYQITNLFLSIISNFLLEYVVFLVKYMVFPVVALWLPCGNKELRVLQARSICGSSRPRSICGSSRPRSIYIYIIYELEQNREYQ